MDCLYVNIALSKHMSICICRDNNSERIFFFSALIHILQNTVFQWLAYFVFFLFLIDFLSRGNRIRTKCQFVSSHICTASQTTLGEWVLGSTTLFKKNISLLQCIVTILNKSTDSPCEWIGHQTRQPLRPLIIWMRSKIRGTSADLAHRKRQLGKRTPAFRLFFGVPVALRLWPRKSRTTTPTHSHGGQL